MSTQSQMKRNKELSVDEINETKGAISSGDECSLPLDEIFGILSNQRRRQVLLILFDEDEPLVLGDLAEQIAAWENGKELPDITSSERKRVYVGLYQIHLPKMDSRDIVEFNKSRGIIRSGNNLSEFKKFINQVNRDTVPWELYYLGLTILGGGMFMFSLILDSIVAFSAVEFVFALFLLIFICVSVGNTLWVRKFK